MKSKLLLVLLFTIFQGSRPSEFSAVPDSFTNSSLISKRAVVVSCSKGWFPFDNMCYRVGGKRSDGALDWPKAKESCETFGGSLAVIHSRQLKDFLMAFLVLPLQEVVWLGMHRLDREDLIWVDGTAVDFGDWEPGEPSVTPWGKGGDRQDCVYMIFRTGDRIDRVGLWDDDFCNGRRHYLCQKSKDIQKSEVPDPRICSDGGWKFESSCFHFVDEAKTWSEAEKHCQDKHRGHLASLLDFRLTMFLNYVLGDHQDLNMWIGIQVKGDVQQWWSNGWPVSYSNWEDEDEDLPLGTCGVFTVGSKWTVQACTKSLKFICEASTAIPPVLKPAVDGSHCPELPNTKRLLQWRDLGGEKCYFFENKKKLTWGDSNLYCMRRGGDLVSIHSDAETNMIQHFVKYYHYSSFMGLYRSIVHDGDFIWTDGTPFDYTHWDPKEPNSISEECGELRTGDMLWNDISCTNSIGYICSVPKIEPNVTEVVRPCEMPNGFPMASLLGAVFCGALVSFLVSTVLYFSKIFERERKNSTDHLVKPPEIIIREDMVHPYYKGPTRK